MNLKEEAIGIIINSKEASCQLESVMQLYHASTSTSYTVSLNHVIKYIYRENIL